MCYIFQCFGWTLDIFQRGVTLILSCCIGFAVCIGLSVAIVAGVAYGYNYSLAEFMEATKPEVTVYVRRGHFYDEPDLNPKARRRSGENAEDLSNAFKNKDYEDKGESEGAKPLTDSWVKAKDVKQYADKLDKFSSQAEKFSPIAMMPTHTLPPIPSKLTTFLQPFRRLAVLEGIPTTILKDGTTKIVLRQFYPSSHTTKMDLYKIDLELSPSPEKEVTINTDSFYDVPGEISNSKLLTRTTSENPGSADAQYEETYTKEIRVTNPEITARPRRRWGAPAYTVNDDEQTNVVFDKVDEDNILYRAEENY